MDLSDNFIDDRQNMSRFRHIVVTIPLTYRREGDFWGRDAGLLVRGFRELGYRSTLVALRSEPEVTGREGYEADGLILATQQEMETSSWWQGIAPDGAILFGWALHHYEAIRKALRTATPYLAERMDTDGMRSPLLGPARYFYLSWAQAMDRMSARKRFSWPTLPASAMAAAWTAYSVGVAPWRGAMAAQIAASIPSLLVESEPAREKVKRWLRIFGYPDSNLHFCPHSVDIEDLPVEIEAKNRPERVVAVGRWGSFQKNFELTWKVAERFVSERRGYEFHFVGDLPWKTPKVDGIFCHGKRSRRETGELLSTARILFAASRYESFHLAAAEALCCGCSVVLSKNIPTAPWFSEKESGTVSEGNYLLQALHHEACCWEMGARKPEMIAAQWRPIFAPDAQAHTILKLWEAMESA
jgi:glycosyltransferase involved in cell wall biosynthesis